MEHLLIIHGAIGSEKQMIPVGEALKEFFQVHYLELDGHGVKADMKTVFNMAHFVDQLNRKTAEIDGDIHVFGYSMGGFVALLAASKGNTRIRSIFTLGTKLKWTPEIAEKESRQLNPEKIEEKVPAFAGALSERHGAQNWKAVLNSTANLLSQLGQDQLIDEASMAGVSCPVHLCLGDQEVMVTEEETMEVKGFIPNSTFSRLSDSKHPIEQVNLKNLSAEICSFITGQEN